MGYQNCTIEESEKVFKIIEQYGFKKDFEKSSQDGRRVYYYKSSYCIFYRKGVFLIIAKNLQEPVFDDGHLKSFLYYVNSSEKPYLRRFIQEYDSILRRVRITTYDLKSRMTEQLKKYNNNIKYLPYKSTLKIQTRDRIIEVLKAIDDLIHI